MILLDTHVIARLSFEPEKLSSRAVRAIEQARANERGLAISDVSLYELASAVERGRIVLSGTLERFLERAEENFVVQQVTREIAIAAARLAAPYPRDPFDRVIGATALMHGLELITADDRIRRSGLVRTIW